MEPRAFQDEFAEMGFHQCWGCGSQNEQGLQTKSYWEGEESVCTWQPQSYHQAWLGIVNGGILATILDCHCTCTAIADATRSLGNFHFARRTSDVQNKEGSDGEEQKRIPSSSSHQAPVLWPWLLVIVAWTVALVAALTNQNSLIDHYYLLEESHLSPLLALVVFLACWQVMTVAMMLPSSMPMVSMLVHASRQQPHPRAVQAAFLAGYALVWTTFALGAFVGDIQIHWLVHHWFWLDTHAWVIGAITFAFVIIPKAFHAWHTVLTDDAYVNSYVTFVAPRVSGQVARVLIDNNNRVKKGDVLVELDPEPYRVRSRSAPSMRKGRSRRSGLQVCLT